MKEEANKEGLNQSSINRTRLESRLSDSNNYHSSILSPEDRLRQRLVLGNGNIRNINVSIDKFFKGWDQIPTSLSFQAFQRFLCSSKLSKVAKQLDDEVLEIAAKAQLLWSVPGIALKPSMFCNLDSMKNFLCKSERSYKSRNSFSRKPIHEISPFLPTAIRKNVFRTNWQP